MRLFIESVHYQLPIYSGTTTRDIYCPDEMGNCILDFDTGAIYYAEYIPRKSVVFYIYTADGPVNIMLKPTSIEVRDSFATVASIPFAHDEGTSLMAILDDTYDRRGRIVTATARNLTVRLIITN